MNSSLVRLFVFFASVVMLAGCGRTVTPAELEYHESHNVPADKREAFRATVTALKSLGYEVVASDEASGQLKTAPKVVVVQAVATSRYTAVAASNSIAWTIRVTAGTQGAVVHAEPRLYSAGNAVDADQMNSDYADKTFHTLYDEIDSNLHGTAGTVSEAPTSTPTSPPPTPKTGSAKAKKP